MSDKEPEAQGGSSPGRMSEVVVLCERPCTNCKDGEEQHPHWVEFYGDATARGNFARFWRLKGYKANALPPEWIECTVCGGDGLEPVQATLRELAEVVRNLLDSEASEA